MKNVAKKTTAAKRSVAKQAVAKHSSSKARAPGGTRKGAGRKPLYKGEKLDEKVSTRLNGEQASGLYGYCEKERYNPNFWMREAALKRAGLAHLGVGLDSEHGRLREGKTLEVPSEDGIQQPVKFTPKQKKGIEAYCKKHSVDEGTFVRDAALHEAGLGNLTVAAERRASADRLLDATGY